MWMGGGAVAILIDADDFGALLGMGSTGFWEAPWEDEAKRDPSPNEDVFLSQAKAGLMNACPARLCRVVL